MAYIPLMKVEKHELPAPEVMDAAFRSRDASFDGVFFAAVATTGIFCRPSCPARKPLPQNVLFYATAAEAISAGYRPCERCKPLTSDADPAWLTALVERVEAHPDRRIGDEDLRAEGLDPATVRRRFKGRYGLSFHAFQRERRLAAAFETIKGGSAIDDAVFDHGYESHSGFRDAFAKVFGDPPGRATRGRSGSEGSDFIRLARLESPLGPLVAGATERGICLLEFGDRRSMEAQAEALRARSGLAATFAPHPLLERLAAELADYFAGRLQVFDLPIVEPGTPFQEQVWKALRAIPYGSTRSYAELAEAVGNPKAVRAVAQANGRNRIAILVPCHRVINADGKLGGYGGGLWRKKRLLEIEAGVCSS